MTYDTRLHRYEVYFYFAGWAGGIFYSLYRFYLEGSYFDHYNDTHGDFSPGWSWIGRKQDVSDDEWSTWMPLLTKLMPWITGHLIVAQLMKYIRFNSTAICCWYIIITATFVYNYLGLNAITLILVQPTISCLLIAIRNTPLSYYVHLGSLILIQVTSAFTTLRDYMMFDERQMYMITVALFWVQLRSICCTTDSIKYYRHRNIRGFVQNFIQITAYYLYLPTFFLGPFFLYSEFVKGINEPAKDWSWKRMKHFVYNFVRYLFWIFFTEFFMHFLYCNAFRFQWRQVAVLNSWAFYGLGYCMGQYFNNKYIVIYGIGGEITRIDDINAPPPPKCIGRIHLYSDMWKHFDRGLYQFLVRYIYGPIASLNFPLAKLVSSFISFSFVFLWHGLHDFVCVWAFLNFTGILFETIATNIGSTSTYRYWETRLLSPRNIRRFRCMLAAPLLSMSAVSNFYFFGGSNIGNLFIERFFSDALYIKITRTIFLYCCCQVSTEMKIIESLQKIKK